MAWFWIVLAFVAFLVEIITPGILISIWFSLAGLICAIVALFIDNIWFQILLFAIVSVLTLFALRPACVKYLMPKWQPTNADRSIGKTATVLSDMAPGQIGRVKLEGMEWAASNLEAEDMHAGERVLVERISGVKLMVRKAKK